MKVGVCNYIFPDGSICNRTTKTYNFICDEHADEQELKPYGRYCEFCGADTFNEFHKKGCEVKDKF